MIHNQHRILVGFDFDFAQVYDFARRIQNRSHADYLFDRPEQAGECRDVIHSQIVKAAQAFLLTGKCEGIDVVLTSKSKGTPASISSMFGYTFGTLNCSARFFARSIFISHTLTTSIKGCFVRFGKYEPETLPQPISPTRIL